MRLLTAAEIAAFLGITASGVRQIVRRHKIKAKGRDGRALLYDPHQVLAHATPQDRIRQRHNEIATEDTPDPVSHMSQ